ncbi:unnamed protein product [Camellia sinensis]
MEVDRDLRWSTGWRSTGESTGSKTRFSGHACVFRTCTRRVPVSDTATSWNPACPCFIGHECRLLNKAFNALKVLKIEDLPKLTNLWKGPTQLVWLGNLTSVRVWRCEKLESMFSLFIARELVQLQDLSIECCDMMEIIVSSEGGEHEIATDKIEFPKLKQLRLRNLPSFTAICKAMNIIELPQLSYLVLQEIPKLKHLWPASDSESNCDPIIQPLFNKKVELTTIENLYISQMENLMEIWPGELQAKLRELEVHRCDGLSNILFSSNSIKGMQNLELLDVQWCQSIGVAFDLERLVWKGISDMALPSLKKVKLSCLPKSLIVNGCGSLINLFSYSLAKLLVKLQDIEVTECGGMECIIANEPNADDEVITKIIMFPQLKKLKFRNLPNLESFCSRTYKFEESLLKTVEVKNCPKLKTLPPAFQCS